MIILDVSETVWCGFVILASECFGPGLVDSGSSTHLVALVKVVWAVPVASAASHPFDCNVQLARGHSGVQWYFCII